MPLTRKDVRGIGKAIHDLNRLRSIGRMLVGLSRRQLNTAQMNAMRGTKSAQVQPSKSARAAGMATVAMASAQATNVFTVSVFTGLLWGVGEESSSSPTFQR